MYQTTFILLTGSWWKPAERRRDSVSTRKPDLDNANVGKIYRIKEVDIHTLFLFSIRQITGSLLR